MYNHILYIWAASSMIIKKACEYCDSKTALTYQDSKKTLHSLAVKEL